MPDIRPSVPTEIKVAEAKAGLYSRVFFGAFCILAGAGVFIWGLRLDLGGANAGTPESFWTTSHMLMVGGAVLALFGGMILPSVFDSAKPVITYITTLPIPMIGGRRATDLPPTPEERNDGSN